MNRVRRSSVRLAFAFLACLLGCPLGGLRLVAQSADRPAATKSDLQCDVCVYGATAAGVIAALQAADEGRTVVLLDCDRWVGGLTTGGLGATDVGNKDAIGGLSRTFYRLLRRHYDRDEAWTREAREDFRGRGHRPGEDCAWTFEPSVAQRILRGMLAERNIEALPLRLDRFSTGAAGGARGIVKQGSRLVRLRCEDGTRIAARVFLDCSYEGDLLAAAGCSFVVGREANATYGETLNGVQTKNATKHQFTRPVDPYVVPGDPSSGLLPHIQAAQASGAVPGTGVPGVEGRADARVQAYCFRMCLTDVAANRAAWQKPSGYRSEDYELLLRYFEAGSTRAPWHPVWMPNRKTDTNNNRAFSTDFIGGNYGYPTASYAERERIVAAHLRYQQGLMWTLANNERVPESVRAQFLRLGPARDEFAASGNWPPVLYVREGRRLIGEHVVSERHCMGLAVDTDPVGMGAYSMDSHNVQRYVDADGHARNEGDVQVRVPKPYGISFRALQPKRAEADNLLVPVCVSSSHIAFGSIRMEPVFMVLAQSAAIAAGLAIDGDVAVQDVAYGPLKEKLLAAGQVLSWPVSPR
ncbi:MAG: FAD-dependent oxidoreductase [Planctomycetota bacterium]